MAMAIPLARISSEVESGVVMNCPKQIRYQTPGPGRYFSFRLWNGSSSTIFTPAIVPVTALRTCAAAAEPISPAALSAPVAAAEAAAPPDCPSLPSGGYARDARDTSPPGCDTTVRGPG